MAANNSKKVCILTSVHSENDTRIFKHQAISIRKSGYKVTYIVPGPKERLNNGVMIRSIPIQKNRFLRMLISPVHLLTLALREKADIYHFHDPELVALGLLLQVMFRKKVIYDVHEDVPKQNMSREYIPAALRGPISGLIRYIEKVCSKRYAGVITATPSILTRFQTYNRNTVCVNNYPLVGELLDGEKGNEAVRSNCCYVGTIDEIRGIQEMIVAADSAGIRLLLGGNIHEKLLGRLERMPEWKNVKWSGFVTRSEMTSILNNSFAGFVIFWPEPNHIEAQPNKLFEYMSAGVPVIASNFPLWREIIEGNNCGICVDPLDTEEIARALKRLNSEPQLVAQMAENGKRAIAERYNWMNESKVLLDFYAGL